MADGGGTDLGTLMTTLGADLGPLTQSVNSAVTQFNKFNDSATAALNATNQQIANAAQNIDKLTNVVQSVGTAAQKSFGDSAKQAQDMAGVMGQLQQTLQGNISVMEKMAQSEKTAKEELEKMRQEAAKNIDVMDQLKSAATKLAAVWASWRVMETTKELAMLSARYETMGVVLDQMAKTANSSHSEVAKIQQALMKTGISAIESRESLSKLIQAHIELADATKLARIAQDAAVIGNINSSEAFGRLIYGLQSAQVEVLRTIGLNVNFEQSYSKLSKQLGKSANGLTDLEKSQARVNAVFEQGKTIAGVYEAAMGTAGKQLNSMKRYVDDIKVALGDALLPAFTVIVTKMTETFHEIQRWLNDNKDNIKEWGETIKNITKDVIDVMGTLLPIVADVGTKFIALYGATKVVTFLYEVATATWAVDAAWVALNTTMKANLIIGGALIVGGLVDWLRTAYNNAKQTAEQFESMEQRITVLQKTADKGHIELLDQKKIVQDIKFLEQFQDTLKREIADITDVVRKQPFDTEYALKLQHMQDELKRTTTLLNQFKDALINVRTPNIGSLSGSENVYGAATNNLITARSNIAQSKDDWIQLNKALKAYEDQLKQTKTYQDLVAAQDPNLDAASWLASKVAEKRKELTKSDKEGTKAADEYQKALQTVQDRMAKLSMSQADLQRYNLNKDFKDLAETLGVTNSQLRTMYDLEMKLITADERIAELRKSPDYHAVQQNYMSRSFGGSENAMAAMQSGGAAAQAAENETYSNRFALEKDLTDKINQMTMKSLDYKLWALDEEAKKMYEVAGDNKKVADQVAEYYRAKNKEISDSENMWLNLSKKTAKDVQNAFSTFFFDAMQGKINSLTSAWQGFMRVIYKITSDYMAQIMTKLLFGNVQDKGGQIGGLFGSLLGYLGVGGSAASSAATTAGVAGTASHLMSVSHSGSKVGYSGSGLMRSVQISSAQVSGLPRYHDGLKYDERLGIFQTGERILSRSETKDYDNLQRMMGGDNTFHPISSQPATVNNWNIQTIDVDSFRQHIMKNKDTVAYAVMGSKMDNHPNRRR